MEQSKVEEIKIDEKEMQEIVEKAMNEKRIPKEKIENALKKSLEVTNYENELNKIKIPSSQNKVIYTDGSIQLLYENGEFFEVSSTDITKQKNKKTRKEATDMYIEYFIKYRLNPLIARKNELGITNTRIKSTPTKQIDKEISNDIISTSKTQKKIEKDDIIR